MHVLTFRQMFNIFLAEPSVESEPALIGGVLLYLDSLGSNTAQLHEEDFLLAYRLGEPGLQVLPDSFSAGASSFTKVENGIGDHVEELQLHGIDKC